ncbi:MAG TPA: hypothetical protein VFF00_01330 [Candidatus Elarobacter sp.]|nr:hypothetical protein [Candidatus Elarobacter sp.]
MGDDKPKDPLALWRDMLAQWETSVNALANKTMATDEYSSSMHGAMGMTLRMQETVREFMAAYLASTNLPSRTEVLGIAERLGAVEARLDRMTELLERIATPAGAPAPSAPAARPPRTKKPPAAEPSA